MYTVTLAVEVCVPGVAPITLWSSTQLAEKTFVAEVPETAGAVKEPARPLTVWLAVTSPASPVRPPPSEVPSTVSFTLLAPAFWKARSS